MDSAIGKTENTIRDSRTRSHVDGGEIGRSEPAIEQRRSSSDVSIDGVHL